MWTRMAALFTRLRFASARHRLDHEARLEFEAHLDLLTERYMAAGMTRDQAAVAARRQFGNTTLTREEIYQMNSLGWLDGTAQDLRYAARQLRRRPLFTAVVVATLAIGIGGTTAVFGVVQAVLIAPLPYDRPGQLVRFYQQEPANAATRNYLSGPHFKAVRDHVAAFDGVAALDTYSETGLDLVSDGRPQHLRVLRVSADYFRTLAPAALRGPGFDASDAAGARRVVLSDGLWRTRFASDPSMVGRTIDLNALPYEVVGITAAGFDDPIAGSVDAWIPLDLAGNTSDQNYSLTAVGRVRHGVSLEAAQAELAALSQTLKDRWPAARLSAVVAVPLQDDLVASSRGPLHLLLIAVGLLLLLACVNVANLVLVRATERRHEFAIRAALGSGRRRLLRQLLVENALVAALAGLLGLPLASLGLEVLRRVGRDAIPRIDEVGFDPTVLGFAVLVTVATALGFGLTPAMRVAEVDPNQTLGQQSRSATGSRGQARIRNVLAAAQLALALTLLAGAGVLLASAQRLQQVNLGFRVERVITFDVNLPPARYTSTRRAEFQEELARRLQTIPGVKAAGGTSRLPATGSYHPWGTRILTGPRAGESVSRARGLNIQQRTVSGDFFAALDIPVLAGRPFDARDRADAPARAIVSASFARHAFPGLRLDAVIGQRISPLSLEREIVGVVGDVALDGYGTPTLVVYHAHRQFAGNRNWALSQVVATDRPPTQILDAVRAEVAALDPDLVVHRTGTLAEVVGRGTSRERFALVLMAAFAGLSLVLAALGLYGVLADSVRQRTQEIGIRMALGASAGQIRTLVLRQAILVLGVGLVLGTGGALALGRWLSSLVFEIDPRDPRILLATITILTLTTLAAAWLPVRRASRVPPRIAMQGGN